MIAYLDSSILLRLVLGEPGALEGWSRLESAVASELVELGRPVLERASAPLPTALGTLDALHLVTALLWKQWRSPSLVVATHDRTLATAARACGLQVIGA